MLNVSRQGESRDVLRKTATVRNAAKEVFMKSVEGGGDGGEEGAAGAAMPLERMVSQLHVVTQAVTIVKEMQVFFSFLVTSL